jgi:hypothetical protein
LSLALFQNSTAPFVLSRGLGSHTLSLCGDRTLNGGPLSLKSKLRISSRCYGSHWADPMCLKSLAIRVNVWSDFAASDWTTIASMYRYFDRFGTIYPGGDFLVILATDSARRSETVKECPCPSNGEYEYINAIFVCKERLRQSI